MAAALASISAAGGPAVPAQQPVVVTGQTVGGNVSQLPTDGTPLMHTCRTAPSLPWPDIGHLAKWSVSSFKFGFGPDCLRDDEPDTFWHSDGPQPHFVTVEFPRKVAIQKLSVYLSFPLDDSYTPSTIAVRAGTGPGDLQDVRVISLEKPDGWITFDVSAEPNEDGEGFKPVNAYVVQMIVVSNHMNGKDTHVRGLRVLGPIEEVDLLGEDPFPWATPQFRMYEGIR